MDLAQVAAEHKRWGYRRAHHELCLWGWAVNRKRIQRLWREEGLRVPARARKRRRPADQPDRSQLRSGGPDEVWAIDFQHDMTADGRALRLVNVVDEFTREALIMEVGRSISADETVTELEALVARRARSPRFLRADNGPELTSHALSGWCRFSTTETAFIEPGAPWQNPFVESFHARVRDELLNIEQFACLAEARVVISDWREDYNTRGPHSALGMRTPTAFAAEWTVQTSA
ncbi:MAG: IS3 family transposase [Solirubrobacteraceae bacterium MAG38_C4-C5]|nr:IS3 family transposase [Candidatus Siliceabacter maunaloa]